MDQEIAQKERNKLKVGPSHNLNLSPKIDTIDEPAKSSPSRDHVMVKSKPKSPMPIDTMNYSNGYEQPIFSELGQLGITEFELDK